MEQLRERITGFVRALPVAHRVGMVAALGVLAVAIASFGVWITSPSYTVLYAGLDDGQVSGVIDELETHGVPYELDAGGSTVLVPRERLYETRASLAQEGLAGRTAPAGYEILEEQGLSVSEFRQRVDYQRALEGELARTLGGMGGIEEASVHIVTPEDSLFSERQTPVTSSIVLTTSRQLNDSEVEAVTFIAASAIEGLELDHITVADADGAVLHAPGELGGHSVATSRNLRQTSEFEQALSGEVTSLLAAATEGSAASVVVRADMNYDEEETESETFNPDSAFALREQLSEERYAGTGAQPGGPVGVDGGPLPEAGDSEYERDDELTEYGVDRITNRSVAAPGRVEGLSVAIVMDDGTMTGAAVPPVAEIEGLVTAALGLVPERGDEVAVSTVPMAAPEEEVIEEEGADLMAMLPQILAALILGLVALGFFLMTRRRQVVVEDVERPQPVAVQDPGPTHSLPGPDVADASVELKQEVTALVENQPEEIAELLRGWLADRRATVRSDAE